MIRWRMVPILPSVCLSLRDPGRVMLCQGFSFVFYINGFIPPFCFFKFPKKKKKVLAISVQISPSLFSFKQAQYIPFSILLTSWKDLTINCSIWSLPCYWSARFISGSMQWVYDSQIILKKKRFEEAVMVFKEDSEILAEVVMSWICW